MTANSTAMASDPSIFKAAVPMKLLAEAMLDDTDNMIEKVRGIYGFKVKNSAGQEGLWVINAKTGKGKVEFNGKGNEINPYVEYRGLHIGRHRLANDSVIKMNSSLIL